MKDKMKPFSIYDLFITEADDDENAADDNTTGNEGDTNDGGDAEGNDTDEEDDGNDEFDIDTTLPDDEGDDEGGEGGGDDTASDDTGGGDADTSSMGDGDEEVNPINTELFDSLTAEEQQMKIRELKRLYKELYTSLDDILERVNKMDIDEDTLDPMSRINLDLQTIKQALSDYFSYTFDTKSYPENDMKYNVFLFQVNGINNALEEIASSREKRLGKKSENDKKKL